MGLAQCASCGFSGEAGALNGDRGRVRELCDFGDSTVEPTTFRDTVRDVLASVAVVVTFDRFFGFASDSACCDGMFSLSLSPDI